MFRNLSRGLMLIYLIWVPVILQAQMPMPGATPAAEQEQLLELKLSTNKTTYTCGEPIILNVRMQNVTDKPVQFAAVLSPTADIEIQLYRPEAFPRRYTGTFKPALYPRTIYWLDPKEVRTLRYLLLYDEKSPQGFLTAEPGPLRLVCRMMYTINDRIQRMEVFPPVDVNIIREEGVNAEVFKLLQKEQYARELNDGTASKDSVDLYQQVVNKYPTSVFAPYCLYAIAGHNFNQLRQDANTTDSVVLQPLNRLLQQYPEFPLMDSVYYRFAVLYNFRQNDNEALRWLVRLYNKFPDSPKLRPGDPLVRKYIYKDQQLDFDSPPKKPDVNWMMH